MIQITNQQLHLRLEKLARTERKITHLILETINEVENRKLYFEIGYDSLYSYLTKGLKYSESAAYRRISAARLLRSAPEVAKKIESGSLNLSQLTQMQKCLKAETKKGVSLDVNKINQVLTALENKNTFESEKILAEEFQFTPMKIERATPQKDASVRLEITLTKEQFEVLQQARTLLSHQCPEGRWSDIVTALAKKLIESKLGHTGKVRTSDGKKKNRRKAEGSSEAETREMMAAMKKVPVIVQRTYLPVKLKRQVLEQAGQSCEYVDPGTRRKCNSKFQLEIDHRKPLALGGENTLNNLRLLCRNHNQWAWKKAKDGLTI